MLKQGYNSADGAFRLAIALQRKRPVDFLLLKPEERYNFSKYKSHYGRESLMELRDLDALEKKACSGDPYRMSAFISSVNNQIQYTMVLSYAIPIIAEKTRQDSKVDSEFFNSYVSNLKRAVHWKPLPFDQYMGLEYSERWKKSLNARREALPKQAFLECLVFRGKMRENAGELNKLANKFYYYAQNGNTDGMAGLAKEWSIPSALPLLNADSKDMMQVFHILRHATYFLTKIFY